MPKQQFILSDFSGGTRAQDTHLAPNECYSTAGCWVAEGTLRSAEGRNRIGGEIVTGKPVTAAIRYYASSGTKRGRYVAKCSTAVWVDISSDDTGNWRPLVGSCYRDGSSAYLNARTDGAIEFFCRAGSYLYITYDGANATGNIRWDGFFYATGTVSCTTPSLPGVTGTGTNFSTAGVKQGDTIYFYDHSAGAWQFGAGARTITTVSSATALVLDGDGFNTTGKGATGGDSVNYIIVRCHPMGVTAGTTTTVSKQASGSLAANTYYFKWRYKNSVTGYTGSISSSGTVTTETTNLTARVSGWSARPSDRQINQVEILRSTDNVTYNLVYTLTAQTSGSYSYQLTDASGNAYYEDTGATAGTALEADAAYHTMPTNPLAQLVEFNNRLYARITGTSANQFWMSTLNKYEYWPSFQFGTDSPTSIDTKMGGYVLIGNTGDYITDYTGEGGSYSITGKTGSNMLVFTHTSAYRFYGWDWSNFALAEAFHEGCKSNNRGAVNCGGIVCWVSPNGPMAVEMGSNVPVPIYRAIWPNGIKDVLTATDADAVLRAAVATYWNGYYILAIGIGADTKNTQLWAFHMANKSWTPMHTSSVPVNATCLAVCDGPTDAGQLICGDGVNGYVWKLFAKTSTNTYWTPASSTGVGVEIKTAQLDLGETYRTKAIRRVIVCYKAPSASQSVTLSIYANGQNTGTPVYQTAATVATDATAGKRQYAIWYPYVRGRSFQLWLTGTFTAKMELEWIRGDYTVHGESQGAAVG